MTFDQAQGMFHTHKTYETAYTYLAVASQRRVVKATNPDRFFNAVGEVASWLSASAVCICCLHLMSNCSHWKPRRQKPLLAWPKYNDSAKVVANSAQLTAI